MSDPIPVPMRAEPSGEQRVAVVTGEIAPGMVATEEPALTRCRGDRTKRAHAARHRVFGEEL